MDGMAFTSSTRAARPAFSSEFQGDEGIYTVAISGEAPLPLGPGCRTGRTKQAAPRHLARVRGGNRHLSPDTLVLPASLFIDRVNSIGLSGNGDVLAVVAETSLYVFMRQPSGLFSAPPQFVNLVGYCETVAVHPSGAWLAAADQKGTVYVIPIVGGVLGTAATWTAEEPDTTGIMTPVKFRSVAVARIADALVAGGHKFLYYLTRASMTKATPGPVARFSAFGNVEKDAVKWVAIAADGSFVTAVVNDKFTGGVGTGRLFKLSLAGTLLNKDWERNLNHPPNSTSIDSSGTRITAADGWPNHTPGTFYLFDHLGTQLAAHPTVEMNWPMPISADGTGIAAGSDDNSLFFFTP